MGRRRKFIPLVFIYAKFRKVEFKGSQLVEYSSLGSFLCLLGQQDCLDVRKDSSLGDGHTGKELVQFLIIPDGQLQVPGDDAGLLVVAGGITSQFKDFSGKILHDCSQVDWGAGTNTFGVVALAEEAVDSSHWKLEACTGRARLGLRLDLSAFASTRHLGEVGVVKVLEEVCLQSRRSECDLNEN